MVALKHVRELCKRLQREGITVESTELTKTSHVRFHLRKGDRTARLIHGCSPSDHRAAHRFMSDARKAFR